MLQRDVAAALQKVPGLGNILRTQVRRGDRVEGIGQAFFGAIAPFEQHEGFLAPFSGGVRSSILQMHLRLGRVGDGQVDGGVHGTENGSSTATPTSATTPIDCYSINNDMVKREKLHSAYGQLII